MKIILAALAFLCVVSLPFTALAGAHLLGLELALPYGSYGNPDSNASTYVVLPFAVEPAIRYSYLFDTGFELETSVAFHYLFFNFGDGTCPYGCRYQAPELLTLVDILAKYNFRTTEMVSLFLGAGPVAGVMVYSNHFPQNDPPVSWIGAATVGFRARVGVGVELGKWGRVNVGVDYEMDWTLYEWKARDNFEIGLILGLDFYLSPRSFPDKNAQ